MRSIWKGAISFGLVTIPVKLYSATEQKDVSFHQVHREDAGRIRYKRVCSVDGEEVAYSEIAKGYELPGGEMVVLTDEDFADLPLSTSRRIDVLQFTPAEQLDPILFNKSYYLEPEAAGVKPYVLLRDALERTGQVAIVKVALRQRESLAALRIREGVFVLETMLWPDEVREPGFAFVEEDVEVRPQELQMAESLIETMAGEFDPSEYHDAYREALQQVIEAKVAGKELVKPEAAEAAGPAVDLMAALRASVDAAKREREGAKESKEKAGAGADKRKAAAKPARAAASGRAEEEKPEKEAKKAAPKRRARKSA
ncbi:non-homologous end joining protein Ku [Sphaerisporangium melleum]|uniref:Non-homologous end joining protein Ku n=1 Tax=Sphaerisporangium melleum TaxID=321316 RepID=A0A917RIZ2_9ACTN|nr:Ku protein [Sphaerisporangium melleum]GGL08750.1 non-homologous end joining protein Ku [Sphaerisporangium melleum]GII68793.1 non-homologous end joining protein Ku [Sphaerisporangium melleum]